MNNRFISLASFTIVLLLVASIGGQNLSAHATFFNPPTFGGGVLKYTDGLTINGKTFDISAFSQKMITPQILPLGMPSTITLKIFDNAGPTSVKWAGIYMNMQGTDMSNSGDTSISYPLNQDLYISDPHNLLGKVTAEYKIEQPFIYVTFHITPTAKMDVSNLIVSSIDDHRAVTNSMIIDGIQFS
jgi:hypothetical protein